MAIEGGLFAGLCFLSSVCCIGLIIGVHFCLKNRNKLFRAGENLLRAGQLLQDANSAILQGLNEPGAVVYETRVRVPQSTGEEHPLINENESDDVEREAVIEDPSFRKSNGYTSIAESLARDGNLLEAVGHTLMDDKVYTWKENEPF